MLFRDRKGSETAFEEVEGGGGRAQGRSKIEEVLAFYESLVQLHRTWSQMLF